MKTRFLLTGGTIDKQYDMATGKVDFGKSHIPEMLNRGRYIGDYVIQLLFLKDSLDITADERQQINEACQAAEEDRLIITHGTDTMVETAQVLARNKNLAGKTIVLTGAMTPYELGKDQDALFNLGTAVAFSQSLPEGVYIAMNGQAFDAFNVQKDREALVFKPQQ